MIPITRKELYLNKIVGNDDYSVPEKPISEEEFFFAEILGEAVQAPDPLTRYQMYLAKIAGREIEIPYPETRLEYFLARAAGMDIETPTPITREEIFWSNYSVIVDFEVEGVPPLSYKAIEGTLKNYRIYGNTVNGESVGDLITEGEHAGEYRVPVTVEGKNLLQTIATSQTINDITFTVNANGSVTCNGTNHGNDATIFEFNYTGVVLPEGVYITSGCPAGGSQTGGYKIQYYNGSGWNYELGSGRTFTLSGNLKYRSRILISKNVTVTNLTFYPMIRKADISDDTYEPYHAPVTINLYLPEQIKMVGDEAEYVDYGAQKQHRVRKNLLQNTATSQTINGVTFTVNNDGSVTCNGTVSKETPIGENALFFVPTITLPAGKYILSGCPAGGSEKTTFKQLIYANGVWLENDKGSGANFILTDAGEVSVRIVIYSGYTCDNLTFYPMIRKAGIVDDTYEPYIENTDLDVTLPALPTLSGTNTLSVGTEVQPSKVYIQGEKEREYS